MKNKSTVLVTGNAGFIGSSLTKRLLDLDFKVVGVDNFNNYYSPAQKRSNVAEFKNNKNFKQYKLDILDFKKLKQVFETELPDKIIHIAARAGVRPSIVNPILYEEVNVKGTLHLLEMARIFEIKQFALAASSSVYGNQEKVPFSEIDPVNNPVSPYAATKKAAEMLCHTYSFLYDLPVTALRFFTVYGPKGRPDMAPYIFMSKILQNQPITRFGDGSSSRDYTYIDDIVDGIVKALNKPFKFEIFNLGNNKPVKLNNFIKLIEKLTGKKAKIKQMPRISADVVKTYADISKAKKMLGWQPKTDLETGMKKFIDWFKENQTKT